MKVKTFYAITMLALVLSSWLTGLINARGGIALAQPASPPPKTLSATQAQAARGGDKANKPPAGPINGWRLVGTVVMDDPGESFAILEYQPTGGQGAFQEGDRLGKIRIKKILPDRVVVDTERGEELLSLGAGGKGSGPPRPGQVVRLKRNEVNSRYGSYRQFMGEISLRSHLEGGRPGGLYIHDMMPDSLFSQIGLRVGDVIVGVNGRRITTTWQARALHRALRAGGPISITIKRGETTMDLQVEIK